MSEEYLICECGWQGHRFELVSTVTDPENHIYCPWCECADDYVSSGEEDL